MLITKNLSLAVLLFTEIVVDRSKFTSANEKIQIGQEIPNTNEVDANVSSTT